MKHAKVSDNKLKTYQYGCVYYYIVITFQKISSFLAFFAFSLENKSIDKELSVLISILIKSFFLNCSLKERKRFKEIGCVSYRNWQKKVY